MMALRWSCSPLNISANSSCSTFVSSPTTDSTISACMLSSGSSSSNSANPCRSFSCAAISSQVETSSRRAFNCCICACALRLSDQKSSAMLSSSRLVICFALFATSKTHHSYMDALLQNCFELRPVELLMFHERISKPGELIVVLAQHCTGGCSPFMQNALHLGVNQCCHCVTTDVTSKGWHHSKCMSRCNPFLSMQRQGILSSSGDAAHSKFSVCSFSSILSH